MNDPYMLFPPIKSIFFLSLSVIGRHVCRRLSIHPSDTG